MEQFISLPQLTFLHENQMAYGYHTIGMHSFMSGFRECQVSKGRLIRVSEASDSSMMPSFSHPMQVCFLMVLAGISMVVSTMYLYMVPFLYNTQHPVSFACYFIYGHYLLIMICFNYFSGVYTDPGSAPKVCGWECVCAYIFLITCY